MKKEYDFSKAERGKFYHPDAELQIPVYLDADVATFLKRIATRRGIGLEKLVNDWIRKDIGLLEAVIGTGEGDR
jgi:hypothetical protein